MDEKAPADSWSVITGDYIVGNPESPVAVATLASHIEAELSGAAIARPCKTENLGIEKVVANIISNPNIRLTKMVIVKKTQKKKLKLSFSFLLSL